MFSRLERGNTPPNDDDDKLASSVVLAWSMLALLGVVTLAGLAIMCKYYCTKPSARPPRRLLRNTSPISSSSRQHEKNIQWARSQEIASANDRFETWRLSKDGCRMIEEVKKSQRPAPLDGEVFSIQVPDGAARVSALTPPRFLTERTRLLSEPTDTLLSMKRH